MYRGRLQEDLDRDVKEYVSSVSSDRLILAQDVLGTRAHVFMLYKTGIIEKSDAVRILAALDSVGEIQTEEHSSAEDGHELLEAYVARRAGESSNRMHTARSRNDQIALATRMRIRDDTTAMQYCILTLVETMLEQAKNHTETIMPLYTHLQHAQPGLLSHYMIAQCDALLRDYHRFNDMYVRLNCSPLGAGPVGGSCLPIDRLATAEMLSFEGLVENSLDATSSRDYISEFVSCIAIMMVNVSRMAEDIILWTSDEFSFVELSDGVSSPSSAMPQKKNPDVLELTRGKAARTIGDLCAVLSIQKGLASGYGRDLQETKEPAWSAAGNGRGALDVMLQVVKDMKVNQKRMGKSADSGSILALAIAEELVARGVPFRKAHREVGSLVLAAHNARKQLEDTSESDIKKLCTTDAVTISDAINKCANGKAVSMYVSSGSASPNQQAIMIKNREKILKKLKDALVLRQAQTLKNIKKTDDEIKALLSETR